MCCVFLSCSAIKVLTPLTRKFTGVAQLCKILRYGFQRIYNKLSSKMLYKKKRKSRWIGLKGYFTPPKKLVIFYSPSCCSKPRYFLQENKTNLLRKLFFQCIYQVCVRFIIISFITDSPFSTLSYYRNSSAIRFRNTTGFINN